MPRKLCQQIDAQRERDWKDDQAAETRRLKQSPIPDEKRMTVQAVENAQTSYYGLKRSIEECRALLRGEDIEVRVLNRPFNRLGGQFKQFRNTLLKAALANIEYYYALAKERVIIDHLTPDVHALRLAVAEVTDPDYSP